MRSLYERSYHMEVRVTAIWRGWLPLNTVSATSSRKNGKRRGPRRGEDRASRPLSVDRPADPFAAVYAVSSNPTKLMLATSLVGDASRTGQTLAAASLDKLR